MSLLEPPVSPACNLSSDTAALVRILAILEDAGYAFVPPSVATHRRVVRRPNKVSAVSLRDVFGWSLPFQRGLIPAELFDALAEVDALSPHGALFRSRLRVSSVGADLFLHSAFPTNAPDAVFFGPDSYRFANFLSDALRDTPKGGILADVGTGSGVGAVVAARFRAAERLILTDLNPQALRLARANLSHAGMVAEFYETNGLEDVDVAFDLVVANPPFIAGGGTRTYRDGGDLHGTRVSLEWTAQAVDRLVPGGRLLLYTGSAIVDGVDPFGNTLREQLRGGFHIAYRELDPDIFGGQLAEPAYADVERIAAIGADILRL